MVTRQARRRRRPVTGLAALLALMLVAAACGDAGDEGNHVTLRFAWWGDDSRHEYTQQIIDIYQREHPRVTIDADFTGWDDYWDRLATNVAGGEAPDVMQQETRYVREYANHGVLLNLAKFMPRTIDPSRMDQSILRSGGVGGGAYAIPVGVNALSIAADPRIFAEAGVAMPDDRTWTWDDLARIAEEISASTPPDVYGIESPPDAADTALEIFARQRGESLFTDTGELGFSSRTARQWWDFLSRLTDSGAAAPPSVVVEAAAGGVEQSLLATNRAAMAMMWNNQVPAVGEAAGRDLAILRLPGESDGPVGTYLKPGQFWSASAETEHPEEAAEFIDFLVNDPRVADLMLADRSLPINLELRDRVFGKLSGADLKAARFIPEIESTVRPPPPLPPKGAGEVENIARRIGEKILFGRLSVHDAVEQLRAELRSATG